MRSFKGILHILFTQFLTVLILMAFNTSSSRADTLLLKDGTIVTGKVLGKNRKIVLFKNKFGKYRINKKLVKKIYFTKSHKKDLAIKKWLEKKLKRRSEVDEEEEGEEEYSRIPIRWNNGRLTLYGARLQSEGDLNGHLSYGYGSFAAFDHGAGSRYFLIPGIRLEGGYYSFKKDNLRMKGPVWSGGLVWVMPFIDRSYGSIILSGTAGMSHLEYVREPDSERADTFTAFYSLGYEFSFSSVIVQCQVRYMYVFDQDVEIHNIGGLFGLGYKIY